jgi:poly(3-hydroxyalkanoate) synthetase
VKCPALLIACEKDTVVSTEAATKAAELMGDKARLVSLPIGHFDIYLGEWFERSSTAQLAFFRSALHGA